MSLQLLKAGTSDALTLNEISKRAFDSDILVGTTSPGGLVCCNKEAAVRLICFSRGEQPEIIPGITIDQLLFITVKLITLAGQPVKKGSDCQLFFVQEFF